MATALTALAAFACCTCSPAFAQDISSHYADQSVSQDVIAPPEDASLALDPSPQPQDDTAAPGADAEPVAQFPDSVDEQGASDAAATVIRWVAGTQDNGGLPYIVIDKVAAELFVFDSSGRLRAHAPVLVGITKGDDSAPGVGDRELSNIPVSERTTPAGRFLAWFGPAVGHKSLLWVDHTDAISLHPVVTSNPKEHRLARLNSPSRADNRITFGCINVATKLYTKVIEPLFRPSGGVVYILPETRPLQQVFAGISGDGERASPAFAEVFATYEHP